MITLGRVTCLCTRISGGLRQITGRRVRYSQRKNPRDYQQGRQPASSGDTQKVSDGLMFSIHGTKQNIQLDMILDNHGLYAPFDMDNNFQCIITLPNVASIMTAQRGPTVGTYTLEKLELEYETIQSADIASEVSQVYGMRHSLSREHATLMKIVEWDKSLMVINENVNLPSKCTKAIVLMLTK